MTIQLDDETSRELEALVDTHGVYEVLQALSDICHAKAEHLQSNWQDRISAKLWAKDGALLSSLSLKLNVE